MRKTYKANLPVSELALAASLSDSYGIGIHICDDVIVSYVLLMYPQRKLLSSSKSHDTLGTINEIVKLNEALMLGIISHLLQINAIG